LAWILIALCLAEISLAATTSVLAQLGIVEKSMLPPDNVRHEFTFHPLLQGVPNPNYALSSPLRIHHDSHGLRGREHDPAEIRHQIVVAAVGGSTTYGLGVSDEETWPAALERLLGSDYAVLNQGVSAYSTVEHVIQTLFYLDTYGVTPRCAVYYIGWNDIPNAHLPNLDPGYAGGYHRGKTAALEARRTPLIADVSPLGDIVVSYLQLWIDTVPSAPSFSGLAIGEGSDSRLEAYFRRNIETIAAIDRQRGITPIFVGQLLNRARLTSPGSTRWWPLVRDVDLWPLQARFNAILKETAEKSGSPAYVPAVEQFQDSDFVDKGHFSARGSDKFAAMLAPFVRANCQKNETTHAAGAAQ
jgi:lysophospholipase L1-like esterase